MMVELATLAVVVGLLYYVQGAELIHYFSKKQKDAQPTYFENTTRNDEQV